MKISLGIHVGHDRGACLIKDGKVIASLSQERLDRIKHSQSLKLPFEAIDALLKYCKLTIEDVSCIGLSAVAIEDENTYNMYKDSFFRHYGCEYIPFFLVHHHDAHAYSTYYSSGFEESMVFVFDGGGDFTESMQESETIYLVSNNNFTRIDRRLQNMAVRHMKDPINHILPFMPKYVQNLEMSLARKYSQITHLLGFGFGQEGKTMGLASYGNPIIDFRNLDYKTLNFSLTYKDIIRELYIIQEKSGKEFQDFLHSERENIAATVQSFIETAVISLISNYTNKYKVKKICLAGGLFLNCLTNHKIIEECGLDDVFILPASGDDGQALGSAYYAYTKIYGTNTKFEIQLPYLGLSYDDECIKKEIISKGLHYKKYDDCELAKKIAQYIYDNKIIAFHRGRSEIGPRALCHRSILANPTNRDMKDILNNRVKHREPFRPFAPTVVDEEQYKYFDLKHSSEYMLLATTVKKEYRADLAAITHVDNTARIQSISKQKEPFLHTLLMEIKAKTGYAVVLNTSFNVAGEPIVESPLDALNTFLTTDIDVLVLENFVVEKNSMLKQ
jgi:carbamoyltransferase